ncbi:phosphate signaling complex PhoU family protein [Virgibacillus kimchii]
MLSRENYYVKKREEMKHLTLSIIDRLLKMTDYYIAYLNNPSDRQREYIFQAEEQVDQIERKIESYIVETISLQQLNMNEIKWLFAINRIIRDLERIGDQLTNIITISEGQDVAELKPLIREFFSYEQKMMYWLIEGIENEDVTLLEQVISHDQHVNKLNKNTYQMLVNHVEGEEKVTESKLKTIVISRFLERIGDHLVNSAKTYKGTIQTV